MAGVVKHIVSHEADFDRAESVHSGSLKSSPSTVRSVRDDYHWNEQQEQQPCTEGNLKVMFTVECSQEVMCCRYSEDGTMLAVGCVDGSVKIFSAETGVSLYNLTDEETNKAYLPCTSLNFRAYHLQDKSLNILLATYASGMVKIWHISTGQCLHTIHETRQTLTASFQNDASHFVTAGSDSNLYVYDTNTKTRIQTCQPSMSRDVMDGHRCRVFSVKFHAKKISEFVSGGWDDTVQFWDVRQEHSIRKLYGPHICGDALDIDPHHDHIVTGSWRKENSLQIWDYASGHLIKIVPTDITNSLLYCAQWLGRDRIMTGGCEANMVRVLDRGTLQTTGRLVNLPRGVYCMDNTRHGTIPKFAVGTSRKVYFLQITKT